MSKALKEFLAALLSIPAIALGVQLYNTFNNPTNKSNEYLDEINKNILKLIPPEINSDAIIEQPDHITKDEPKFVEVKKPPKTEKPSGNNATKTISIAKPFRTNTINENGIKSVAVLLKDGPTDLELTFTDFFYANGYFASNTFFDKDQITEKDINGLYNANEWLLEDWKLINHIDRYFVGWVSYTTKPSPVRSSWTTATLTIRGSLVSIADGRRTPISITEYGTGTSESQAYDTVIDGLKEKLPELFSEAI